MEEDAVAIEKEALTCLNQSTLERGSRSAVLDVHLPSVVQMCYQPTTGEAKVRGGPRNISEAQKKTTKNG